MEALALERPQTMTYLSLSIFSTGLLSALSNWGDPSAMTIYLAFSFIFALCLWAGKRWSWFFSVFYAEVMLLVGVAGLIAGKHLLLLVPLAGAALFWLTRDGIMGFLKVRTDIKGLYMIMIPFVGLLGLMTLGALLAVLGFFSVAVGDV